MIASTTPLRAAKRWLMPFFLFSALLLLFVGCSPTTNSETTPVLEDYITVIAAPVTQELVLDTHTFYGPIQADRENQLLAPTSGEVSEIYVANGDAIAIGMPILKLKTTNLDRQIAQARKSVELASTNLKAAQERYEDALEALEKNRALLASGAITQSQFDQSEAQASPAARDTAKIQLEQSELQLKQLRDSLEDYTLTAKQEGILSQFETEVGDLLQMGTPIGKLASQTTLKVSLLVSESIYVRLNPDTPVYVALESHEGPIEARISDLGDGPSQGSKLFPIEVQFTLPLEASTNTTTQGLVATVNFELGKTTPEIALESDLLLSDTEGYFVYKLEGVNGDDLSQAIPKRQNITPGFDNGVYTVVKSGLAVGDWIVVKGQQYISPDRAIKVLREED